MSNIRTDSWASALTEEQQWDLYHKALQPGLWSAVAAFAVKEYGLEKMPSQAAYYRWKAAMRRQEHEHHMLEAAQAAAEAAALGKKATKDEALVAAFKALATEAALATDAKTAVAFVQSAVAIHDRLLKEKELALKSGAEVRKDEELKLAREKFEYDAAKKAMQLAAEIKTVSADDTIDDDEKIKKVREVLFG